MCLFFFSAFMSFGENREGKIVTVRICATPYAMYQIWNAGHQLGIDKEFGLNVEVTPFTSDVNAIQAMVRGNIDIVGTSHSQLALIMETAPEVISVGSLDLFKGFIFIGRSKEWKSISQLIDEMGLEKAREYRLKQLEGKTFLISRFFKPIALDTLAQAGLNENDAKFILMADDQKSAAAFIRGEGDIYMGSLPQEQRLLSMPGNEFINIGGSEILGPAGLWYGHILSTRDFMEKNREILLKVNAMKYRVIRLFDKEPMKIAQYGAKTISQMTGGDFTIDQYIEMETVYDNLLSIQECKETYFNPESRLYWKKPMEYYIKIAVEQGDLKKMQDADKFMMPAEELFWELLKRDDLMKLINAPLNY